MKRWKVASVLVLTLLGLLLTVMAVSRKSQRNASSLLISKVLRSYNISQSHTLDATIASAKKLTYSAASENESPKVFERRIRVAFKGNAFRRENCNSRGIPEQIDLFDGHTAYRLEFREGRRTGQGSRLEDWQFHGVEFSILTFGVIPLLRHLQNPTAEITGFEGSNVEQAKLVLKIASGSWTLYLDDQYLIRKIEIAQGNHYLTVEYDDYRMVEGIYLPFKQRLFDEGRLFYEFAFSDFDLNPSFSSDFFTREALYKEEVLRIGLAR